MNALREAAQAALDALRVIQHATAPGPDGGGHEAAFDLASAVEDKLLVALAESQQPVTISWDSRGVRTVNGVPEDQTFKRGDLVRKRSGSAWRGRVVGTYSTKLTPDGYAIESDAHAGSVQIYPAAALELVG